MGDEIMDEQSDVNNGEMENCSNDDTILGNNLEEDPLNSDMLTLHEEKKEYNCFVCHKIFGKNRSLEEHMSDAHKGITMPIHEENKLYECNICNKRFGGRYDMKKHIETVHEGKKKHEVMKEYKCFVCDKIFKTNKKLKGHMSFAHKEKLAVHEKKKKYGCITCKKSFGKKFEMKKHIESFHNTIPIGVNSISRKAQDILRESLKFDSAIETHSMNIAGTPEKKEKSAKIEVKLLKMDPSDDKSDMKKHIESVHEEKNKHTICNICKKGFAEKAKLIAHNASFHEGKKPHSCPTCEASFDYPASLKKHIATVHDGQKQHSC